APLRPALRLIRARRDRYGRVALLYGARGPGDMLFLPELRAAAEDSDIQLVLTADHAEPGWAGEVGVVPAFLPRLGIDPAGARAFVCGPEAMMRYTVAGLRDLGIGTDRIYVSMERNMKCAVGLCGRCQFGGDFICRDGPVFAFADIAARFAVRER
ncbi:MAG: iron-sulfur cluster-binding protein, partial [Alphaproteobacteria bacterium]